MGKAKTTHSDVVPFPYGHGHPNRDYLNPRPEKQRLGQLRAVHRLRKVCSWLDTIFVVTVTPGMRARSAAAMALSVCPARFMAKISWRM
jgi:hypothetical protein